MKLLTEIYDEVNILTEAVGDSGKNVYLQGIMMQFDTKNRNNRIYPSKLKSEVHRYITESVNQKTAWGELGHPTDPKLHEDRFCHLITELREDGKNFVGKALILNTPMGNIVKGLTESGGKLGMSSRALGGVTKKGDHILVENMRVKAIDCVADPSAPEAFVDSLMESKEWICENGIWKEKDIVLAQKLIKNTSSRKLKSTTIKLFEEFFKNI